MVVGATQLIQRENRRRQDYHAIECQRRYHSDLIFPRMGRSE
jgi:hypothetical protein